MPDIRAYVANFLGSGHEFTKYKDKDIRDSLSFDCDGFSFQFIQKPEIILGNINDFKNTFTESTEVLIKNVSENNVKNALKVLDRICWLLSFASLSRVMRCGYEYPDKSGQKNFSSVIGVASYFRPSIDIRDGKKTIDFINCTYDNYKRLEKTRKLNVVIDYLVQAEKSGQPRELKLIISFVILENLKDTYARSLNIPYVKGFFRKVPKPVKKTDQYHFVELLHLMLKQVKMKKGLKRVKNLRDEIIHSGVTRKPHSWQWKKYEQIHDLLREYILRLLGFRGNYLLYSSACEEYKTL